MHQTLGPREPVERPGPRAAGAIVALVTLAVIALTVHQAFERYRLLRSGWSWDLAFYNQWAWSLTKGDGVITVRPLAAYATENGSTNAPCWNESSSGIRWSQDALATKYSASAPLIENPKWSSPLLTTHSPTTRSPGRRVVTTEAKLEDGEARLLAHATSTILVLGD